jgi:hypothetical protein
MEDLNTQISSIRNGIAERMAHGKNANEISKDLNLLTKPELVRVIMNLLENPSAKPGEGGSIKEPPLDARQLATILFSLQYLENTYNSSGYVHSEHIEGLEPMNHMEINQLREDIKDHLVKIFSVIE